MLKIKTLSLLGLMWLCIMLPVFTPVVFAYSGQEMAEDLDNYFTPVFPVVYGEIIGSLPAEGLAGVNAALKGVEIFDYIYKIGKIGDSLASGSADMDTALDGATVVANLAIKFMADEATKKILIAGVSVGTLPLTALITTIDIARSSCKAVAQSKVALDLEVLYYSIESNPALRNRNRELGSGNPIKTDAAAVEHLFRKCLNDPSWTVVFKTYVTKELNQTWPEPSLWDRLTVDNDFLQEAAILKEKTRLKSHMAILLLELNKVAIKQEARVVVAKQMQALRAMAGKISKEELKKALSLYQTALIKLPNIQKYADFLPEKIKQYEEMSEKATAVELEKMRVELLPKDMKRIITSMGLVRYLPIKGKHGDVRQSLLEKLKEAYTNLYNIKNRVSVEKINTRLEEESKKLVIQGQIFEFTRYPCSKFFEDYLPAIEADVKAGILSPAGLEKIFEEIKSNHKGISESYEKDYKENDIIYKEKIVEFDDKIAEVSLKIKDVKYKISVTNNNNTLQQLRQTLNSLEQTLNSLKEERKKLVDKFEAYNSLFQDTATIDSSQCEKIINELKQYIESYGNRFQNIQSYLKENYNDAISINKNFAESHSGWRPSEGIVSKEKIDEIRGILSKNTGSVYAYLDLEYLKELVQIQPDKAMSANIQKIMEDITEALNSALNQVVKSKITVRSDWSSWTISQLKYMKSSKYDDDIQTVIDSVDSALSEFRDVDQDDISKSYRNEYNEKIDILKDIRKRMESYKKLKPLAGSLASQLEAYISQADEVNLRVEEDRAYLVNVYIQFINAKDQVRYSLTNVLAKALSARGDADTLPVGISGKAIKEQLKNAGIINFSLKKGLGINELFKEPFIDMYTDKEIVTIKKEHLHNLLGGISDLPVDSYKHYSEAYNLIKGQEGLEGFLFSLIKFDREFVNLFNFDAGMEKTAQKIIDTLNEKREQIKKVQAVINEKNARFSILTNKIDHLIKFCNEQIAMGSYSSVMTLGVQADEVNNEYNELKETSDVIDEALIKLTKLIELAKEKYIDEQNRLNNNDIGQEEIKNFYNEFKQAYESRDDYQVMNLIDGDWEASDGTTLMDLEDNLSRTFRTFDEIQYSISNINISPMPRKTYLVTYDVVITSRKFSRNLKHEEKSSVSEEVAIDEKGKVKIVRTLNGRFWQD